MKYFSRTVPGIDIGLAGDSNLWVHGLVHASNRACFTVLDVLLQACGLEICNPLGESTPPQVIESVRVHNHDCASPNAYIFLPLLASDLFALEIHV